MHENLRGGQALARLLRMEDIRLILDIGSGEGHHAQAMREAGRLVATISLAPPADHVGDFLQWDSDQHFDAIWACHVLEHQVNPGLFLAACRQRLRPQGVLALTVPPAKHEIVGGHVTLWNAGLLLYQLVLAGFDCRRARVGSYGYNISVLVRRNDIELPPLAQDFGDIGRLKKWFPVRVSDGFDGELPNIGW